MPSANAATKKTPMMLSSLIRRFCEKTATRIAVATPATAPPSTRLPWITKATASPGNTAWATASPMKAMPRSTT